MDIDATVHAVENDDNGCARLLQTGARVTLSHLQTAPDVCYRALPITHCYPNA